MLRNTVNYTIFDYQDLVYTLWRDHLLLYFFIKEQMSMRIISLVFLLMLHDHWSIMRLIAYIVSACFVSGHLRPTSLADAAARFKSFACVKYKMPVTYLWKVWYKRFERTARALSDKSNLHGKVLFQTSLSYIVKFNIGQLKKKVYAWENTDQGHPVQGLLFISFILFYFVWTRFHFKYSMKLKFDKILNVIIFSFIIITNYKANKYNIS